jgi:hypothetical protein
MFNTDKKEEIEKIKKIGGVYKIYPNFAMYIESISNYRDQALGIGMPELVMKAGGKMEYKRDLHPFGNNHSERQSIGDFHFSINHVFKGFIETHFITKFGTKINGYLVEIKGGFDEKDVDGYKELMFKMLNDILKLPEFKKYVSQLENMEDFANDISNL